jgi:hypothetical protein
VPPEAGFAELLALRPELLERRLLDRYYEPATLANPRATAMFVTPDRRPLPHTRAWLLAG